MKIDLEAVDDEGRMVLEADKEGLEKIYSEGIAFMLLKGLYTWTTRMLSLPSRHTQNCTSRSIPTV
jgi:hypothetical protein